MEKLALIEMIAPMIAVGIVSVSIGWVVTTWMRVKHGYPLDGAWGQAIYPRNTDSDERVKLVTQENAQLRAEIGALKDRLGNVERIVTDSGYHLTQEIDRLRDKRDAN